MNIFQKSVVVAIVTFILDFTFHYFMTNPMETMTYFVLKFFLSFFVAAGFFSLNKFNMYPEKRIFFAAIAGLIFSTLMSVYYRAWELGEAGVPFGSRAPDIFGIVRSSIMFPAVWWLGHASFFFVGVIVAMKLSKK
ncbi:MAG: hypothetical protein AAB674_00695 [Patescibacteria group bacterium]